MNYDDFLSWLILPASLDRSAHCEKEMQLIFISVSTDRKAKLHRTQLGGIIEKYRFFECNPDITNIDITVGIRISSGLAISAWQVAVEAAQNLLPHL